jgi:hypothetical protein
MIYPCKLIDGVQGWCTACKNVGTSVYTHLAGGSSGRQPADRREDNMSLHAFEMEPVRLPGIQPQVKVTHHLETWP